MEGFIIYSAFFCICLGEYLFVPHFEFIGILNPTLPRVILNGGIPNNTTNLNIVGELSKAPRWAGSIIR